MSARPSPFEDMVRARKTFYGYVIGCSLLLVIIQLLPKDMNDRTFRLVLVVLFFTCLASLAWSFDAPFRDYLKKLYSWRYERFDASIRRTGSMYVHRLTRITSGLAWLGTLVATVLALWVLSSWPQGQVLAPSRDWLWWGWVLGTALVPIYVVGVSGAVREAVQLRQMLQEQIELSGARPSTEADERVQADRQADPPVVVTKPLAFRAGDFDWHWSDFYKNTAVFGQSGSGKTLCVLNAILDGLIASSAEGGKRASGLILDPKGDFRAKIERLCRRHGRGEDLLILDPSNLRRSIRWNPLDSPDDELEIAGRFAGVMETLGQKGEKDTFWIDSAKTFVRQMIALLREAKNDGTPPSLADIYSCATSDTTLREITDRILPNAPRSALRAVDYVVDTWEPLAGETKSVVRAYIANMLDPFLMEPYEQLFSGSSTLSIGDALDRGKILYVYMPIAEKETMAKVVSTFVKLEFYREVLKRPDKGRPSFFLCDEFQSFFTIGAGRGDADAFERTRQSNHANIVAFQNLPALLKQAPKRDPVDNLLGNCGIKIFLRNTDSQTNEYASALFGEQLETLVGAGVSTSGHRRGNSSRSLTGSTQWGARVRKEVFPALAQPSREDGVDYAEAMAHISARAHVSAERLRWRVHAL